jgi:hypothetical protein
VDTTFPPERIRFECFPQSKRQQFHQGPFSRLVCVPLYEFNNFRRFRCPNGAALVVASGVRCPCVGPVHCDSEFCKHHVLHNSSLKTSFHLTWASKGGPCWLGGTGGAYPKVVIRTFYPTIPRHETHPQYMIRPIPTLPGPHSSEMPKCCTNVWSLSTLQRCITSVRPLVIARMLSVN